MGKKLFYSLLLILGLFLCYVAQNEIITIKVILTLIYLVVTYVIIYKFEKISWIRVLMITISLLLLNLFIYTLVLWGIRLNSGYTLVVCSLSVIFVMAIDE